jgi:NADPH:quinone reductase-like Zn-dependent oxidoreductase
MMKAAVMHQYGSANVLHIEEMPQPKIKPDQLLVKVYATTVNPIDWKIRKGMLRLLPGIHFPLILGFDVSGEVVAVGDRVTHFKVGDLIYANTGLPGGAYAEFIALSEKVAALKPTQMSHEQAAAVPGSALTALQALRNLGHIQQGQTVLVNGASGGVGSFAVQLAKALNTTVTAVCSTKNMEWVKALGADRVMDYIHQDFTQDSVQYDIIFDAVGKRSFSTCRNVLKPSGIYITTLPNPDTILWAMLTTLLPGQKAKIVLQTPSGNDLAYLRGFLETGKLLPYIDRTYPLSDIVAAHSYSETEHAAGKIVITVVSP